MPLVAALDAFSTAVIALTPPQTLVRKPHPRVLVLLACRDGAAYVERQIRSVLAQMEVEVQLEVRDDGSSDGTADVIERLSAGEPQLHLWPDRDPSGSAAANFLILIRAARVDGFSHVALCDQDDEWYPTKLARAVQELRASGCAGYSAAVRAVWPDGRSRVLAQRKIVTAADYLFEGAGQGCTFVLEAKWFGALQLQLERAAPLLDKVHYHDWLIYALARASGAGWYFDSAPTMTYRQHEANDTGARSSWSGVKRRLQRLRAGWYRDQVALIAAVVLANHPDNKVVLRWTAMQSGATTLAARLVFIACNGRRRRLDRLIQMVAVALRYL